MKKPQFLHDLLVISAKSIVEFVGDAAMDIGASSEEDHRTRPRGNVMHIKVTKFEIHILKWHVVILRSNHISR